jgi:hypothetical protein
MHEAWVDQHYQQAWKHRHIPVAQPTLLFLTIIKPQQALLTCLAQCLLHALELATPQASVLDQLLHGAWFADALAD